jgi:hypothetical protein
MRTPRRNEQAVAIHWMLCLYLKHGPAQWRTEGEKELKDRREKLQATPVIPE